MEHRQWIKLIEWFENQLTLVGYYVIKDYGMLRKIVEDCSITRVVEGDCPPIDQHDCLALNTFLFLVLLWCLKYISMPCTLYLALPNLALCFHLGLPLPCLVSLLSSLFITTLQLFPFTSATFISSSLEPWIAQLDYSQVSR